jgi:hypothetical protein
MNYTMTHIVLTALIVLGLLVAAVGVGGFVWMVGALIYELIRS